MSSETKIIAAQNTGNPVLDSLVNLMSGSGYAFDGNSLKKIHAVLLELAEKEPGGLKSSVGKYADSKKPSGFWAAQGSQQKQ